MKDANDLLQDMRQADVPPERQTAIVAELLAAAPTLVEQVAGWAGEQTGPARDQALRETFALIARLDDFTVAQYRTRLAKALGVSVRDFAAALKASRGEKGEDDERGGEVVETLGGYIGGWLVDYVYDPEAKRSGLVYRDPQGNTGTAPLNGLVIDGVRYIPKLAGDFIVNGGVLFPSRLGELRPTAELVAMVEAFLRRHYLFDTPYTPKIVAYYVMLTWIYDSFNALPYLRATGEAGSGKSELMKRIGHLCYRLITASGANTAATFFRTTEIYRGTVFLDEADLHDGGDMSNDLVKYLNLGAMKGNPISRLVEVVDAAGNKNYEPGTFQTFGPKLIAMRKEFRDDAVGSRSLTLKIMPRETVELLQAGVRLYIDSDFRSAALSLRNLLLRWRLEHWQPEIEIAQEMMDVNISARLNQVTMPIKALARNDAALLAEIERFLQAYNQEMVLTRSMTIAARVVEALWKIYTYPDLRAQYLETTAEGSEFVMIGAVRKIANEIMDEMNEVEGEEEKPEADDKKRRRRDELTARGVGAVIRNELQLHVGQRRGTGFPVFWDQIKMEALGKRYGIAPPDLSDRKNGHGPAEEQGKIPW